MVTKFLGFFNFEWYQWVPTVICTLGAITLLLSDIRTMKGRKDGVNYNFYAIISLSPVIAMFLSKLDTWGWIFTGISWFILCLYGFVAYINFKKEN